MVLQRSIFLLGQNSCFRGNPSVPNENRHWFFGNYCVAKSKNKNTQTKRRPRKSFWSGARWVLEFLFVVSLKRTEIRRTALKCLKQLDIWVHAFGLVLFCALVLPQQNLCFLPETSFWFFKTHLFPARQNEPSLRWSSEGAFTHNNIEPDISVYNLWVCSRRLRDLHGIYSGKT